MDFPAAYAVKHKDLDTRMASRSGGIFTAISDYVLDENGIVYGCVLNEKLEAEHVRADNAADRNAMRGSKYIQSDMGDMFRQVKNDLQSGKKVLFSGTSCQIAGLRSFLGEDFHDGLLCVDIVCHGVPSPLIWKEYIRWQEEKHHGKVVKADFRNKRDFGWNAHVETLCLKKGTRTDSVHSTVFKELFFSHMILRPACHKCPYKDIMHPADITIADFWGINKAVPGFNDDKGVSLVLVNNELGKEIFEKISEKTEYRACRIEECLQPALQVPTSCPDNRSQFWNDYQKKDFGYIVKHYGTPPVSKRVKNILRKVKRKIMK